MFEGSGRPEGIVFAHPGDQLSATSHSLKADRYFTGMSKYSNWRPVAASVMPLM